VTTKELVGPLARVWFVDGTALAYSPPRDTCDIRYAACREHSTACDCREAQFAEVRAEMSAELNEIKDALRRAFGEALKGHPTFGPLDGPDFDGEDCAVCRCTGCVIARALYRDHVRARSPLDQCCETTGGGP